MEQSFSFRQIMYRILALVFLIAVIGAVFLIAEDTTPACIEIATSVLT